MDLAEIIEVKFIDIIETPSKLGVDTIVNAADVTLMGSTICNSVDYAIHQKVNEINCQPDFLKMKIKETLNNNSPNNDPDDIIRCRRGQIIKTSGYGLCNTLLHTVGPINDQSMPPFDICASSTIDYLETCYRNIIQHIYRDPNIHIVAIPVISSGTYSIDFSTAIKVEIATLYNTLLEYKRSDRELFSYCKLKKIYITVQNPTKEITANRILDEYKKIFKSENRVVYCSSYKAQMQYIKEIKLHDQQNGHFSIARFFRLSLVYIRTYLFPITYLKDIFGKYNWESRRKIVEFITVFKMILPLILYILLQIPHDITLEIVICLIMLYNLIDTITYLITLIVLADIQRPSANIIRSLILLFLNYIEVSFDLSVASYILRKDLMGFQEALAFCLLGVDPSYMADTVKSTLDYILIGLNQSSKFFIITLALGYFTGHLRERKFRTK